jgi:hypothetical protein
VSVPISVPGDPSVPLAYTVPGSTAFIPRTASATFDGSGAAGAFLPTMRWVSQSGQVIGRYTGPQVAAGSSAEVSWAPFLEQAAVASAGLDTGMILRNFGPAAVPQNSETLIAFGDLQSYHGGSAPLVTQAHALDNPFTFTKDGVALVMLRAQFPAGTGTSRYIRCAATNAQDGSNYDVYSENLEQLGIIGAASFNDYMVVSTFLVYGRASAGGPFGGPTKLYTYAFQSSTGNRTLSVNQTIMMLPATVA